MAWHLVTPFSINFITMDVTSKETPVVNERKTAGFSLVRPGELLTMYKVGKTVKFLNHDNKEAQYLDKKIPVATQEQLKEVYDADASYVSIVKAPEGYEAPWAKKK